MASAEPVEPHPPDEARMPVMFDYCIQVYEAMESEASWDALGTGYGEEEGLVYDGFLTKLIKDLSLPVPYYTKITQELRRMDCVRQVRRGGSTTTSRWVLLQEPTRELYLNAAGGSRKPTGRLEGVEQQVRDLVAQINELRTRLDILEAR